MKKLFAFLLLTLAQADPVQQNSGGQSRIARRSGCQKKIEDSTASCDDGDFMIELPLCALEARGMNYQDLFMGDLIIKNVFLIIIFQ